MAGKRFWILLSAVGLLLLDQLSKQWWLQHLQPGVSHRWIPGLLNLRLVWNDGAAFSLFRNGSTWLGWISLLVSVGLLIWIWRRGRLWSRWQASAAAFLLAGSIGNGIDRWRYGAVIDGLELVPISFPVFNLADVAINLAVSCLLIEAIRQR